MKTKPEFKGTLIQRTMQSLLILCFLLLITVDASAQNVGINDDNSDPHASAMLDVKSANKGFLPPRMTLEQRNAIANPAAGLMVFCTDCGTTGALSMFLPGSGWITYSPCVAPAPVAGTHIPDICAITWNWNAVTGTTGYKWNTVEDFTTATDMGTGTSRVETGLAANTPYTRYVWAYNSCGTSIAASLVKSTLSFADPIAGYHLPGETQITWNWKAVAGATGYKWGTTNNFQTAEELGTNTSKIETGLLSITTYTRYVWAYCQCQHSSPTTLSQSTTFVNSPVAGNHIPGNYHITWKWNPVANATGYKWNTTNDYNTAEDLGTATSRLDTSLFSGKTYTRYVWAYNGNGRSVATSLTQAALCIGMSYQGGKIFYFDATGEHGLIAAFNDMPSTSWGCFAIYIGTSSGIGTGQANTTAIVNGCNEEHAARYCNNYITTFEGIAYDDWFLPSIDELNQMYLWRAPIGGFSDGPYWSSSEDGSGFAFSFYFLNGIQHSSFKISNFYVRPIRAF